MACGTIVERVIDIVLSVASDRASGTAAAVIAVAVIVSSDCPSI